LWFLCCRYTREEEKHAVFVVSQSSQGRDGVLGWDVTYSIVKRGETTVPYWAASALLGSEPFSLGEIVSVQIPHQHRILGEVSIIASVSHRSSKLQNRICPRNALAKVGRMTRPLPQTTLKKYTDKRKSLADT
jgi:hypothetical protein